MSRSLQARVALAALVALAACSSAQPERAGDGTGARVGSVAQALSAAPLKGANLPPKTLALTFDDGPYVHTAEMSTYLASQGIRAAFFLNGGYILPTALPNPNGLKLVANASAIVAQLAADGHLVANHSTTHRDLVSDVLPSGAANVVLELAETDAEIAPYVPGNRFLFRAPYGFFDQNVLNALSGSAMSKYVGTVAWEIGGEAAHYPAQAADWACWSNALQSGGGGPKFGVSSTQCGDAYLAEITAVGRGIVLMHDSSESDNGSTLAMVKYMVPILKAQGYTFVRADEVPDIVAILGPAPCDPCTDAGTKDAAPADGGPADAGHDASTAPPREDAATAPPLTPDVSDGTSGSTPPAAAPDGASTGGCSVTRAPRHGASALLAAGALAVLLLRRRRREAATCRSAPRAGKAPQNG